MAEAPDDPWPYVWPVTAPIVDGFRAPASQYAPGNRGLEFNTTRGQSVVAARAGTVTFAGHVAGRMFVSILHVDGVKTSYGGLVNVFAVRGQQVATGGLIGTAGDSLHVSARIGDAYIDPAVLFGGSPGRARLVMASGHHDGIAVGSRVVRRSPPDTIARRHQFGCRTRTHLPLAPTHGRSQRRSQCSATVG